jgi:hypothetical protein
MGAIPLMAKVDEILQDVVLGPIVVQDKISWDKLQKPK